MFARTLIASAVAVAAVTSPLTAQSRSKSLAPSTAHTFAIRPATDDAPNAAKIRAMLEKADESLVAGRSAEARKRYRAVIGEQRTAGLYPGEALWRLATAYFLSDDTANAAGVLDELASEAARFGDPSMEIRATFESAILNQKLRRVEAVAPKLARVQALMQSPAISDAQKEEITSRIANH
jgi:hypothetical protein